MMEQDNGFYWEQHPKAEKACLDLLDEFKHKNGMLLNLEEKIVRETSSRLLDRVDHLHLGNSGRTREMLADLGFVREPHSSREAYYHPGALLPGIVLGHSLEDQGVALRVESVADFLQVNGLHAEIEGSLLSRYRRAFLKREGGIGLMVVERRGTREYEPVEEQDGHLQAYLESIEAWQNRPRSRNQEDAFAEMRTIAERIVAQLGHDLAAHIICGSERVYWLSRNWAARLQQARHDALGLGWTNHDHYTFRSSRSNFKDLVDFFLKLGFRNRERFYAGAEAGWGAQVMENASGLTLFLDLDLAPTEVETSFSEKPLEPLDKLGTVGLWCGLHGDSIFSAGLHHMAARFDFDRLISDSERLGVRYMAPFSNFTYLKQAFSAPEKWAVDPDRVEALLKTNAVTPKQADTFISNGAVGSHLENIERRDGYKGFNRKNVSAIIRETDPRTLRWQH